MKILNLTAQKPFDTGSGVYLMELMKVFKKEGHENALICGIYNEDRKRFSGKETVYPVIFKHGELDFPILGMSDEMPYESKRYRDMTEAQTEKVKKAFTKQITEAIEKEKPDLLICHHLYGLAALAAQLAGDIPVCGICHGSDIRQLKQNAIQREAIIDGIRGLDRIFCLHKSQKKEVVEFYGVSEEKVTVIGVGYNSDVFKRNSVEKKNEIIFAGKISEKKGVLSLVRAMQKVPDSRIVLAGGAGNQAEYIRIKEEAEKLSGRAVFAGKLSQEKLAAEFNVAKVFVLPSFYEGLPLVALEALACGCRVVMTDLPGIKSWYDASVENHNIIFVKPPKMQKVDIPYEETLPEFEERLALAIKRALSETCEMTNVTDISWDGIAKRILKTVNL